MKRSFSVGLLGARGHVGKEMIGLIASHPNLTLQWVSSRRLAGQSLESAFGIESALVIEDLPPSALTNRHTDIVVLALPNGISSSFVDALASNATVKLVIDLSADHRFDSTWRYTLPELTDDDALPLTSPCKGQQAILLSNPGCYATAMQLALAPLLDVVTGTPVCFGVSGYSGAGTTPSQTNQRANLSENLIPYKLVGHLHELEVSHKLEQKICFTPHVGEFFRGLSITTYVELKHPMSQASLFRRFSDYYANQPLVHCQHGIPTVRQVVNTHSALIGGFEITANGQRAVIVSCLDNLLKGAASQAVQNINLALGLAMDTGLNAELADFRFITPTH